ncbi:MAG: Hsp20/alpha crystallin family protein [Methanospirillum sp.]|nr:Hsp20/alpha crystallin family protein [Methanospirillum sp.]
MEDILRKILSQAFGSGQLRPGMIGVNIIMAGNLPPGFPFPGGSGPGHDIQHPPIEVIEWDDRVIATCELRGLFDEHINVAIADNTLHIIGFDGKIRYRSSAPLPPVVESSCIRTFRNGILELVYLARTAEIVEEVINSTTMTPEISGEEKKTE